MLIDDDSALPADLVGRPAIVHLIDTDPRLGGRPLAMARADIAAGIPAVIVGVSGDSNEAWHALSIDGIPAILVHPSTAGSDFLRAEASGGHEVGRLLDRRQPAQEKRQVLAWRRKPVEVPPFDHRAWATSEPDALDLALTFGPILESLDPIVIHAHCVRVLPAAMVHVRPFIGEPRTARVAYEVSTTAIAEGNVIEKTFINDCDALIGGTTEVLEYVAAHYEFGGPTIVVSDAPSSGEPHGPSIRSVLGMADDVPLIAYAGPLDAEHGLQTLLSAVRRMADAHVALVVRPGDSNLRTAMGIIGSGEQPERMHILARPSDDEFSGFLSTASIGVIPYQEIPEVPQEIPAEFGYFLHAGIPVVATGIPSIKEKIKEWGCGAIARFDDIRHLASTMQGAISQRESLQIGITPEVLAETSWAAQIPALIDAHRALVGEVPKTSGSTETTSITGSIDQVSIFHPDPEKSLVYLGIGPANYASQANEWARAAREHLGITAESFAQVRTFARHPDRPLPDSILTDPWAMLDEMEYVFSTYSHLMIDAFLPVFGGLFGRDLPPEIQMLQRRGISLALAAHGTEIRHPARHAARMPYSIFHTAPADWVARVTAICETNARIAASFDGPLFVSTPDLLLDLPQATWLPLVMTRPDRWNAAAAFREDGPIRVLHRPTRTQPPTKGSTYIVPVLRKLADEGLIKIARSPENVPADKMPSLISRCDVYIDQILSGSYGVTAVEAMWIGRVVVGRVAPDVRELIPAEVPVVDATPETLEEVIRGLAADRDRCRTIAQAGAAFVREFHDGRMSAQALAPFISPAHRI